MLWWWLGALVLLVPGVAWLLSRLLLEGPRLDAFDGPCEVRIREEASSEVELCNQKILASQSQSSTWPQRDRLQLTRRMLDAGWCRPEPSYEERGIQFRSTRVDGLPAEWVLAPGSNAARRLLYLHGGSFMLGSCVSHRLLTSALAEVTGCAVLALAYRLLPENTRRDGIVDCQTAYRWILNHGPEGESSVQKLYVAGDSAGGNLALMLLAWARDQKLRPADAAVAMCPGTDLTLSSPSVRRNVHTDYLLGKRLKPLLRMPRPILLLSLWRMYRCRPNQPLISPIFGDLHQLPPTLVQVSLSEMLLDDARRYVNKAAAAGSAVQLQAWPDLPHVWHLFLPILPEAQEAVELIGQWIAQASVDRP